MFKYFKLYNYLNFYINIINNIFYIKIILYIFVLLNNIKINKYNIIYYNKYIIYNMFSNIDFFMICFTLNLNHHQ